MAISTGFHDLDGMIGGLKAGSIIAVASRPSIGRTTLALNIAEHISMVMRLPVAVFCDAEGAHLVVERFLASRAGIDRGAVRYKARLYTTQSASVAAAVVELRGAPLMIDDTILLTATEIASKTLAFAERHQNSVRAVVIDIEYPLWGAESRKAAIANTKQAMTTFRAIGQHLGATVIITSRLSRRHEHRRDFSPRLTDVRFRDTPLVRAADVVVLLYRDEIYDAESSEKGLVQVTVAKNRHGQTGSVLLKCHFERGRLSDYSPRFT